MTSNTLVVREVNVDRNLCIRLEEIKILLDHYPLCSRRRLQFAILAVTGMRGCELAEVKATDFSKDFSTITYKVYKPKKRYGKDGTLSITYKRREVNIPPFLRAELKEYVRLNYMTFKGGFMFREGKETLRRELSRIRARISSGELLGKEWEGFLEQTDEIAEYKLDRAEKEILEELKKEHFTLERRYKSHYRITLHSFRRTYITYRLWQKYKGDLILTNREIGHSKVDTTFIYAYSPDKIGLPENCSARHTFDYFFGKGKSLSNDEREIRATLPMELVEKTETKCRRLKISFDVGVRKALFNWI